VEIVKKNGKRRSGYFAGATSPQQRKSQEEVKKSLLTDQGGIESTTQIRGRIEESSRNQEIICYPRPRKGLPGEPKTGIYKCVIRRERERHRQ